MASCISNPSPPPTTVTTTRCNRAMPFDAATGAAEQSFSFMPTPHGSFDLRWYNLPIYSTNDSDYGLGPNWFAWQFARIINVVDDVHVIIFLPGRECGCRSGSASGSPGGIGPIGLGGGSGSSGGSGGPTSGNHGTMWFTLTEEFCYMPNDISQTIKKLNLTPGVKPGSDTHFQMTAPDGTVTLFLIANGLITKQTSPGGQVTEYIHHPTLDRIEEVRRVETLGSGTNIESRRFSYDSNERVTSVLLSRSTSATDPISWTDIRRLSIEYYSTTETGIGNPGDLKSVTEQYPGFTAGTWIDDKTTLFRYYTASESNGFKHGLKYVLSPEGYDRMSDPENATNAALAPYASVYYEYDNNSRRVTKVATEGGLVENTISYVENSLTSPSIGDWVRKAVVTMPDSSTKTVYSNHLGQDLLIDDEDGTSSWVTHYKYNGAGQMLEKAYPSAVASYSDTEDDLDVMLNASSGLIEAYSYYESTNISTGSVKGYLESSMVREGANGIDVIISKNEYDEESTLENGETVTVYPVDKTTLYRNTSDALVTEYDYLTWNRLQPTSIKTTLPSVPSSENGLTYVDPERTFDVHGRVTSSKNARGITTEYAYDLSTGTQTQMDRDPSGLNLVTDSTPDNLGRTETTYGPTHSIGGQNVRTATWTVRKEGLDETWTGRGYKKGANETLINPVMIQKHDKDNRTVDSIEATRGSGVEDSGALSSSDSFPQSSWTRWQKSVYGDGGRLLSSRVYFDIPSSGEGTAGVNYDETTYDYDSMGRQNYVKKANGTITRTVFDVRGLVESVWVGTNDTGATDANPSGGGANGNNMVEVSRNEYDNGNDGGDANLTKSTRLVDSTSTNDRVVEMEYDFRNRLVNTITTDGTYTFHQIATLDNLGRTIVSETKRDDAGTLVLIAKSESHFDSRGRTYESVNYGVSDSGAIGQALTSRSWFDGNGNVVKSSPAGSEAFTKTVYDAVDRPIESYFALHEGTTDDDPTNLVDNTVFTQSVTEYDDVGNVIFSTSSQRIHTATGTGKLNGPGGSQPKSRDSYVIAWHDELGRTTESANYGTNGGSVPSRGFTAPASSDTILVSKTIYNADGEVEDSVDASGKVDRTEYDDAGRTTKVTENFGGTETVVTRTEFDDGQMVKQIAENSDTGDQTTEYVYGVTLTDSEIESNDLLQKTSYPDLGEVISEYNRQGQQIEMTDQNGTLHQYVYDELGRRTTDKVTLAPGSDVDDDVLRIETAYDDRMRVEKMTSFDATTGGNVVNETQNIYNEFNQLTIEYQQPDGAVNTSTSPKVEYAYASGVDNHNRVTRMTYPNGRVVNYIYGASGSVDDRLSRIAKLLIGGTDIVEYDYLGANQVVIQRYVEPSTPVEYTLATGTGSDPYDALDRFGRVIDLRWQKGSLKLVNSQYSYDRASNKLTCDNSLPLSLTQTDEKFSYDELHRLTDYERGKLVNGSITNPRITQDWTLDQTGNWKGFDQGIVDAVDQSRTHNKVNEITDITVNSGAAWADPVHDDNGNMTVIPQPNNLASTFDATWDAWNRMVRIENSSNSGALYSYDGGGRRVIKKLFVSGKPGETRMCFYSTGSQVLEERVDSSTTANKQYLWGIRFVDDLILRDFDTTNDGTLDERLYSLADPRFSIVALVDPAGAVKERYAYDAYGRVNIFNQNFGSRSKSSHDWEFLYTGRRLDIESGLYFFRARYYHAEMGRFISRDPIGYVDGMSLYRGYFVPGGTDPLGLLTLTCECSCYSWSVGGCGAAGWSSCNRSEVTGKDFAAVKKACEAKSYSNNGASSGTSCGCKIRGNGSLPGFCGLLDSYCNKLAEPDRSKCLADAKKICDCMAVAREKILEDGRPVLFDANGPVCVECTAAVDKACNFGSNYFNLDGEAVYRWFDYVTPFGGHMWHRIVFVKTGETISTVDFWGDIDDWWGEGRNSCGYTNNF